MKYSVIVMLMIFGVLSASCQNKKDANANKPSSEIIDVTIPLKNAQKQLALQKKKALKHNRIPRTLTARGDMHWTNPSFDWTEGFFPGSLWYVYDFTKNEEWREAAEKLQKLFEDHKYKTDNHDLGFIFNTAHGNGYTFTGNEDFKAVMITAADSLSTRFDPDVGCIKSWDVDGGWQSERGWKFPVIIDNMMNLELLFKVSEFTGNDKYRQIAIAHANTTLKNQFREDNSSYHVIDYDPETGEVRKKETAQGFADESAWARGQAWGLYGFTVCYRYTEDKRFLQQAEKIATYISNQKNTDKNAIPYWDYDAPNDPNEPVDVSAAAITASALIELDDYSEKLYLPEVNKILNTLAMDRYTAKIGEQHNFILKHSVGSIPHGHEIDVPLNYADYYYIEALMRYRENYSN